MIINVRVVHLGVCVECGGAAGRQPGDGQCDFCGHQQPTPPQAQAELPQRQRFRLSGRRGRGHQGTVSTPAFSYCP